MLAADAELRPVRTTVSPDGLKVYNTADRQACVALQAGRLSASTPACTIQRSVVSIEWHKQTCTLLRAGHLHVFTYICQSAPAGLQLDGVLAPSRTPAEQATTAQAHARALRERWVLLCCVAGGGVRLHARAEKDR